MSACADNIEKRAAVSKINRRSKLSFTEVPTTISTRFEGECLEVNMVDDMGKSWWIKL